MDQAVEVGTRTSEHTVEAAAAEGLAAGFLVAVLAVAATVVGLVEPAAEEGLATRL